MARGGKRDGAGRKAGSVNKTTREVREVIALIAQRNAEAVETWLAEIKDPAKRMDMYLRMLEYHIPKLQRSEVTGPGGGPMIVEVVRFADTPSR